MFLIPACDCDCSIQASKHPSIPASQHPSIPQLPSRTLLAALPLVLPVCCSASFSACKRWKKGSRNGSSLLRALPPLAATYGYTGEHSAELALFDVPGLAQAAAPYILNLADLERDL
jgi:hypothetical protein